MTPNEATLIALLRVASAAKHYRDHTRRDVPENVWSRLLDEALAALPSNVDMVPEPRRPNYHIANWRQAEVSNRSAGRE